MYDDYYHHCPLILLAFVNHSHSIINIIIQMFIIIIMMMRMRMMITIHMMMIRTMSIIMIIIMIIIQEGCIHIDTEFSIITRMTRITICDKVAVSDIPDNNHHRLSKVHVMSIASPKNFQSFECVTSNKRLYEWNETQQILSECLLYFINLMGFTNVIKSECILVEVKNIPLSMLQKTSTHTQTTTTVSGVSRHASSSCCREIVHLGLFQQEDLQRCDGKFQSCSHQEKVAKPSGYDQTKKIQHGFHTPKDKNHLKQCRKHHIFSVWTRWFQPVFRVGSNLREFFGSKKHNTKLSFQHIQNGISMIWTWFVGYHLKMFWKELPGDEKLPKKTWDQDVCDQYLSYNFRHFTKGFPNQFGLTFLM